MRRASRGRGRAARCLLLWVVLGALTLFWLADSAVRPTASALVQDASRVHVTCLLEEAAADQMADFGAFFAASRDENGRVTDYALDAAALQKLKAALTERICETLEDEKEMAVQIPWGSLTGSAFLSGRGSRVTFRLAMAAAPELTLSSYWTSAGINQTRCQLFLDVSVHLLTGIPLASSECSVESHLLLLDSVVVGEVPAALLGRYVVAE